MPLDTHLSIIAAYKNDVTFLQNCFYKQPFKLANITEHQVEGLLRLMIMSSSPGILSNDHHNIKIEIKENAKVHISTQSYQRLFTMAGKASQNINVSVESNGSLIYVPHPMVPHKASDFSTTNTIVLNKKHNLLWSEIITCGRKLSGEEFMFTRLQNVTNIYLNEKLIIKENILLEPLKRNVNAIGQLEGYTHQSTLMFVNDSTNMEEIFENCYQYLLAIGDIAFGISMLPVNGLIFRILGHKGEQLFNCNNKLVSIIQQLSLTKSGAT